MLNRVEILAPAGSYEAMTAAVSGGCDAVYAAAGRYGARAFAKNFSIEELKRALDYLHLRNKKLYLAMNILIKEDEMDAELFNTIKTLYEQGLDGVIVQDMGLMKFIYEEFPDLPIHASTQVSITNPWGAEILKQAGVSRIVPARECSLEEIRLLKETTDMEIECFVHGALCFCYSGQCLLSSLKGGRSGNRGRCAQPCRRLYSFGGSKRYILSPKDICTLEILPDLIEAGIDSFKIEGRMKNPEYSMLTSFLYKKYSLVYYEYGRKYYENAVLNEKGERHSEFLRDIRDLMDIFNRGGFSKGYYFIHNGMEMMSESRPNHYGSQVGLVTGCMENGKKAGDLNGFTEKTGGDGRQRAFCIKILPDFDIRKDDVLEIRDSMENTVLLLNGSMDFEAGKETFYRPYSLTKKDKNNLIRLINKEGKLRLFRLRNHKLLNYINDNFLKESVKNKNTPVKEQYPFLKGVKATAYLEGKAGKPLKITLKINPCGEKGSVKADGGKFESAKEVKESIDCVTVYAKEVLEPAKNSKISFEKLKEQINKTGDYPFDIELDISGLSGDCFIPMSLFNGLRRQAMEALKANIINSYKGNYCTNIKSKNDGQPDRCLKEKIPVTACSVISAGQMEKVLKFVYENPEREFEIILNGAFCQPLQIFEMLDIIKNIKDRKFPKVFITMPAVFSPSVQDCWEKYYKKIKNTLLLNGIYVRTIDELGYAKKHFPNMEIRLEPSVYQWNKKSWEFYRENGITFDTLSPEMSLWEFKKMDLSHSFLPVYGCQNVMVSSQCLIKNRYGCAENSSQCLIKNRHGCEEDLSQWFAKNKEAHQFYEFSGEDGTDYFVSNVCAYCYNLIFEKKPKNLLNYKDDIGALGLHGLRFDFYRETPDEVYDILSAFLKDTQLKGISCGMQSEMPDGGLSGMQSEMPDGGLCGMLLYEGRFIKGTD